MSGTTPTGVVGGGIGGITAALAIIRTGRQVVVLERSPTPIDTGSVITLSRNAMAGLDAIGVGDEVRAAGSQPPPGPGGFRTPRGEVLLDAHSAVQDLYAFHRADLHRVLRGLLPDETIRSVTHPEYPGPRYVGYTTWRAVTTTRVELDGVAGESWDGGERFGTATARRPGVRVRRGHPPIPELLEATDPTSVIILDIYDLPLPLPPFAVGNVVLLGDAAHAMTPDIGQGAGQAIEDAVVLSVELARTPNRADALKRYDASRRPRTEQLSKTAHRTGQIAQAHGRLTVPLRNAMMRLTPPSVPRSCSNASPPGHHPPPENPTAKESRVEPDLSSAQRVLADQPFSVLLGTRLVAFEDTSTILEINLRERHRQQHGFAHGGVISYLVDNAITFAAGTVSGPDLVTAGISVEYVHPGVGVLLRAEARVVSRSSHSAVMRCDVTAHDDNGGPGRLCAIGHGRALIRPSRQPLESVR